MVSVIIPARKEPYLNRTIKSLYDNAKGPIEVIVVFDGDVSEIEDSRVLTIEHKEPLGRRVSMNEAAAKAKGEYLFHLDAHCSISSGWDEKLRNVCGDNTLVVSVISTLAEDTWELKPGHNYTFVSLNKNLQEKWWGKYKNNCDIVEETMALTGCGWMIRKDYYWAVGGCDESLGQLCHLGPEWALKVWCHLRFPGRLILRTDVKVGHLFNCPKVQNYSPQHISDSEFVKRMREKYGARIDWLRKKFNPPGWDDKNVEVVTEIQQKITVRRNGDVDVVDVNKDYFPVERPKDSTITFTDWRCLWKVVCDRGIRNILEFGPGLSTEILDRCGLKITSYETKKPLLDKLKVKLPGVDFKFWDGKLVNLNGQYDMAFIDGPFGGENREPSYQSVAESEIKLVACHDSNRKADKVWVEKYFSDWKKVDENKLKTGLLILER